MADESVKVCEKTMSRMADIALIIFGTNVDIRVLHKLAGYTIRKWELSGCEEDYLPCLFENECRDYISRERINRSVNNEKYIRYA